MMLGALVPDAYGAALRDYVFLALLVVAAGYLTPTLRVVGIAPRGRGAAVA